MHRDLLFCQSTDLRTLMNRSQASEWMRCALVWQIYRRSYSFQKTRRLFSNRRGSIADGEVCCLCKGAASTVTRHKPATANQQPGLGGRESVGRWEERKEWWAERELGAGHREGAGRGISKRRTFHPPVLTKSSMKRGVILLSGSRVRPLMQLFLHGGVVRRVKRLRQRAIWRILLQRLWIGSLKVWAASPQCHIPGQASDPDFSKPALQKRCHICQIEIVSTFWGVESPCWLNNESQGHMLGLWLGGPQMGPYNKSGLYRQRQWLGL